MVPASVLPARIGTRWAVALGGALMASMLLAPIMMLLHTQFVVATLLGAMRAGGDFLLELLEFALCSVDRLQRLDDFIGDVLTLEKLDNAGRLMEHFSAQ